MSFNQRRRQVFLGESYYKETEPTVKRGIEYFDHHPVGYGGSKEANEMYARASSAYDRVRLLLLQYTAGDDIEPLRHKLEDIVSAYERYGKIKWAYYQDRNEPVFDFEFLDDYFTLIQLIGLCFLLHRRDLLPRIAALQDGIDSTNGGFDWLFEEFMAYAPMERFSNDYLCFLKPYQYLAEAMSSDDNEKALTDLHRYLKNWYKDLSGIGWHDSHKPDEAGNSNGYFGYWSFEAGAAVLLLGIEDDSSLHQYLYYPKDLVAWAKAHADLSDPDNKKHLALRVLAGQPCLRTGFWFTPASPQSRQRFEQGQIMPDLQNPAFDTIWQWDEKQS